MVQGTEAPELLAIEGGAARVDVLAAADPPVHARQRELSNETFSMWRVAAGNETTTSAIGSALRLLLENPEIETRIRAGGALRTATATSSRTPTRSTSGAATPGRISPSGSASTTASEPRSRASGRG